MHKFNLEMTQFLEGYYEASDCFYKILKVGSR